MQNNSKQITFPLSMKQNMWTLGAYVIDAKGQIIFQGDDISCMNCIIHHNKQRKEDEPKRLRKKINRS